MAAAGNGYQQANTDVGRILSDASTLLASTLPMPPPAQFPTPTVQPPALAPFAAHAVAQSTPLKFASLPNGQFGEPSKVVPLNRTIRSPGQFFPNNAASTPTVDSNVQQQALQQQLQLQQHQSHFIPQQPQQQQFQVPQQQFQIQQQQQQQLQSAHQHLQQYSTATPGAQIQPAQQPSPAPPAVSGNGQKTVHFFNGQPVTDTDTAPIHASNPPNNSDSQSLHMSILKSKNVMDIPKSDTSKDTDDIDDEDEEYEEEDEYEEEEEVEEDEDDQHTDVSAPISSIRKFDTTNAPRQTPTTTVQTSFGDSFFSSSAAQRQNASPASRPTDPNRFSTPSQNIASGTLNRSPTTSTMLTQPQQSTQAPPNNKDAAKAGSIAKICNFFKGYNSKTNNFDTKSRNIRIIVAVVIVVALVAFIIGLLYKFYPRKNKNTIKSNTNGNGITSTGRQMSDKQQTKEPETKESSKSLPTTTAPQAKFEQKPVSPIGNASNSRLQSDSSMIDFDMIAKTAAAKAADDIKPTTPTQAVVPITPITAEPLALAASPLDSEEQNMTL